MMRIFILAAALVLAASQAGAQVPNGPPIPPDQVLRQQNAPLPAIPAPVPQAPSDPSSRSSAPSRAAPALDGSRDRVAECQHQATVERVPRSKRGSYVHNCMN
jgi:hypothetical protein